MRSVCIINNYNYDRYLGVCLDAIFAQTLPFDRVIAVDDGSTDGSRDTLAAFALRHAELQIVAKPNGGQLSCFNAAREWIQDDDIVFLCDADDVFPPDYVERMRDRHARRLADFYFCEPRTFQGHGAPDSRTAVLTGPSLLDDCLLPCTSAITRQYQSWIGSPTSCLSLTGALYRSVFPYPHEADWRTRADDVVVYGAALLGARKLFVPSLGVDYRVHGANHFFGRVETPVDAVVRRHRLERLFGWYCAQQHIERSADRSAVQGEHALAPAMWRERFFLPDPNVFLTRRQRRKDRWATALRRCIAPVWRGREPSAESRP